MAYEVKDGDVALVISPVMDENDKWTGILKTCLLYTSPSPRDS